MENIPVDRQFELEQEYSELPVYCSECQEQLFEENEIEMNCHPECYDKLIEEIEAKNPDL